MMEWERTPARKPQSTQGVSSSGVTREGGGWAWEIMRLDRGGKLSSSGGRRVERILREETYTCGFCRGTGEKPRGAKCSVCKGKKLVALTPPVMVCAYCKGRGEERPRTNITCLVCRGKGFVSIKEPIETCFRCRGTGAEPHSKLPCVTCRGKGVVTIK